VNLRSIGVRLTLWYTLAFAAACVLIGAGTWLAVRQSLYHAIDESLRDRVEGIRRFVADHEARLDLEEVKEEFRAHGDLFRVVDGDGRAVHEGAALAGAEGLPAALPPGRDSEIGSAVVRGEPMRVLSQSIAVGGRRYTVEAVTPLRELREGLSGASAALIGLVAAALLLAAAGGYSLSRRALAPVDRITRAAREISADSLSRRLEIPETGDELARLSATLNDMIGRLETSFQQIARFTADASHELRTPLALMRTTAEVALRGEQPPAELRGALGAIIAEVERTSHLVENLLLIAKADSGDARLQRIRVDLAAAVQEACSQASVLAHVKGLSLEVRAADRAIWVIGDPHALRRVFLILLDNAIKYTPGAGTLQVALAERDGVAIGEVRDTGIGIPAPDLPHVFERFYRVDRARSRDHGGAGLGLAIARWIVAAHGGSITVESGVDRGSVFSVLLPCE
jgi:heavy metal sensor kinase